jgi:hypothetical protein
MTETFKARFKAIKQRFMSKVVSRRLTLKDAFKGHLRSSLSVFIPKLTPDYVKPCLMFHVSNGASSCLIRVKEPEDLAKILEDLVITLRSDRWLDAWWRISEISESIIDNSLINLDEEMVDMNAWNSELSTSVDIDLIKVKKEVN